MSEDLFEDEGFIAEEEGVFARDLQGRLVRLTKATAEDFDKPVVVQFAAREPGRLVEITVPKAKPATDAQGNILLDSNKQTIPRPTTIYDAAAELFVHEPGDIHPVPTLCHLEHMNPVGVCRICVVSISRRQKDGSLRAGRKLLPACQHRVEEGMVVHTIESAGDPGDSIRLSVSLLTDLLVSKHGHDRPEKRGAYLDELAALAARPDVDLAPSRFSKAPYEEARRDESSSVILLDRNNCILCNRCVRACNEVRPFQIIGRAGKGRGAHIGFDLDEPMGESGCVSCGECMISCPTGALTFTRPVNEDPWREERPAVRVPVPAEELVRRPDSLFRGLPFAFLKWNEGAVARRELSGGEELCREGENGASAFLIEEGRLEIIRDGRTLQVRGPEDVIVGEMACMTHQPRTATVKALEPTRVLEVRKNVVYMLQRNSVAREILDRVYRERAIEGFLTSGRLFRGLDQDAEGARLSRRCIDFLKAGGKGEGGRNTKGLAFERVEPGVVICQEGEAAEDFYIVRVGFIEVTRGARGQRIVLDSLKQGDHFGEIAVLSGISRKVLEHLPSGRSPGMRTATCTALDHVELVKIPAGTFRELLDQEPQLKSWLEERAVEILKEDARRLTKVSRPLGEFLRQGLFEGKQLLVIDLESCTRCDECVRACVDSHDDGFNRLSRTGLRYENHLVATACRSCHDPRCLVGCPVDAIHRREQGLSIVINDRCIGCGLCAYNCPFGNISLVETGSSRKATVAVTCDQCESLPGGRGPSCVAACPHGSAIRESGEAFWQRLFGDDEPSRRPGEPVRRR